MKIEIFTTCLKKEITKIVKPSRLLGVVGAAAAIIATSSAHALSTNWQATNPNLVTTGNAISQVVDGITVTAQGYTVEFNSSGSVIYGPFPTTNNIYGNQSFGPLTQSTAPSNSAGLGLLTTPLPGINVTGQDYGGQTYTPGFDNGFGLYYLGDNPSIPGPPLQKLEFALFTFSAPVDVSTVITTGIVNSNGSIWAAGGSQAPDLNSGIVAALSGYTIQNSLGGIGPTFIHTLNGFDSISYLFVGAPPPISGVGQLATIAGNQPDFLIQSISLTPSAVPIPATAWMFGSGLVGLTGLARRRKAT